MVTCSGRLSSSSSDGTPLRLRLPAARCRTTRRAIERIVGLDRWCSFLGRTLLLGGFGVKCTMLRQRSCIRACRVLSERLMEGKRSKCSTCGCDGLLLHFLLASRNAFRYSDGLAAGFICDEVHVAGVQLERVQLLQPPRRRRQ